MSREEWNDLRRVRQFLSDDPNAAVEAMRAIQRVQERLREVRKDQGLSLRDAGRLLGISGQAIWRYEATHIDKAVALESIQRYALALGYRISIDLIPLEAEGDDA